MRSWCKLCPIIDEKISFLSPMNLSLNSCLELVNAFSKVSNTLFDFLWKRLTIFKKRCHSNHICNNGNCGLSGISNIFGVLFCLFLFVFLFFIFTLFINIKITLDFSDFIFDCFFLLDFLKLFFIGNDLIFLYFFFKINNFFQFLLLVPDLFLQLSLETADFGLGINLTCAIFVNFLGSAWTHFKNSFLI